MLLDSAHIQAQDARHLRKRGHDVEPLYDIEDVERTLRLVQPIPYHSNFAVSDEVRCEFLDAGHILGAAIVVLDCTVKKRQRRIVFTGDHGRKNLPILRNPDRIPECDALITESTYGNREHPERGDMLVELASIVNEEMQDGGRIIIPAFSVGRTQSIVMFLGQLMRDGAIPDITIHVDSPMSREATRIMAAHPTLFDDDTQAMLASGHDPFYFSGVHYIADVEESKALNQVHTGVIVSASGMCESGRILHHLSHSLGRRQDCVLLVGYQAHGTLGRKLLDGMREVNILGEAHSVNCKIRSMTGFSAHADHVELLAASRHLTSRCKQVFVVHGEEEPAEAYASELRDAGFASVYVPAKHDCIEID